MQKSDIKILIVDDDPTLGKALAELIKRSGYKALLMSRPDEALASVKLQPVHAAIIDCMLPKMNGRDLALKLREDVSATLPIILMSGIFKDKNYTREATQATGAIKFFAKPFDIKEIVTLLDSKLTHLIDIPLIPIHGVLSKVKLSAKERIKAINDSDSDSLHSLDLPWIYSLLLDQKISGHLNIFTADGEVAGVGFNKGNIVQVNLNDTESYFGVLLVEKGFISSHELEAVMAQGSRHKRVGERLLEANVLSPHAIHIVMSEQHGIRLSKTIANTSVKVNFIDTDEMREDAHVDRNAYCELVNDWISSKIPLEWLKAFYIPWMRHTIVKGAEYSERHRCFTLPLIAHIPQFAHKAVSGITMEQLFSSAEFNEADMYRAFHLMLISRMVVFGDANAQGSFDFKAHRKRLEKLDQELDQQNYFDRLGVSQKAKESEIKRAYHELAKALHPDKLTGDTPADLRELTKRAFGKISQAYEALSNSDTRTDYVKEMEQGRAEMILQAESLTDQGRTFLSKGDIKKARELLEKAITLAPPSAELRLLLMWAEMKTPSKEKNQVLINRIKEHLGQIPPEERHNPTFYFVKGLFLKATDDSEAARKSFEHAVSIDADFIDARRELNLLKLQKPNKQTDLLRGDLKDVVGLLFKKKK